MNHRMRRDPPLSSTHQMQRDKTPGALGEEAYTKHQQSQGTTTFHRHESCLNYFEQVWEHSIEGATPWREMLQLCLLSSGRSTKSWVYLDVVHR